MRKEDLLFKKNETVKNLQWYVKDVITDEDLKYFSIPQLERLIDLIERAETFSDNVQVFAHYRKMKWCRRIPDELHILKTPEKSGKKPPKSVCRGLLDKGISII